MRQQVIHSKNPALRVRQGTTDWHPADDIRRKIKELNEHGIFVKLDGTAEGPFTLSRAFELLQTINCDGIEIKTGVGGQWVDAAIWLAKVREMQRSHESTMQSLAAAIKNPKTQREQATTEPANPTIEDAIIVTNLGPGNDDRHLTIVQAVVIDEHDILEAALVEPAIVEGLEPESIIWAQPIEEPVQSTDLSAAHEQTVPNFQAPVSTFRHFTYPQHKLEQRPSNPVATKKATNGWITSIVGGLVSFIIFLGAMGLKVNSRYQRRHVADRFQDDSRHEGGWRSSSTSPTNGPQMVPPRSINSPGRTRRYRDPMVSRTGRLFRPTFQTSDGTVQAGTAFAARIDGKERVLIVTALHLFGPAGGLDTQISSSQLASRWQSISLQDFNRTRDRDRNDAIKPLTLTQAKPLPESSDHGDVAICVLDRASSSHYSPLKFATESPKAYEPVWLVLSIAGSEIRLMSATAQGMDDGWMIYRLTSTAPNLTATSGAPVVNTEGEVVAVHAGASQHDGHTYGIGTPVDKFLTDIASQY